MKDKDIIGLIMKRQKVTQQELADRCGYKRRSNVASLLGGNATGLRSDSLVKFLSAMGCELIIRDASGNEWQVTNGEDGDQE